MILPASSDDPFKKEALLRQIGVSENVLILALQAGDAAAAACTTDHPPMAAGFYRFAETVCSLGRQMANQGWTRKDYKNFSTIVRPDGVVAIAVASGDDGTGDLASSVTTRSPKGITTAEAVALNLKLPLDDRYVTDNSKIMEAAPASVDVPVETWFLLHDRRDGLAYSELSLPRSMNAKGYIETWSPRIPLTRQALDPAVVPDGGEPPVNPEVVVKRRDPR